MLYRYHGARGPDTARTDLPISRKATCRALISDPRYRSGNLIFRCRQGCAHPRCTDEKTRVGPGKSTLRIPGDIFPENRPHASSGECVLPGLSLTEWLGTSPGPLGHTETCD